MPLVAQSEDVSRTRKRDPPHSGGIAGKGKRFRVNKTKWFLELPNRFS